MPEIANFESRRRFLKVAAGTATAAVVVAMLPRAARASGLPHLNPNNAAAQALGYVDNTNLVNPAKFPSHTDAQRCGNCAFCSAKAGAKWGPCQLFPGNDVNTHGWCSAHKMRT